MFALIFAVPTVVANKSLSLPIPAGYRDATAQVVAAKPELKDVGIIQLVGMRGDTVVASINFLPAERMDKPADDPHECAAFAGEFAQKNNGKRSGSAIVDAPGGKACQITVDRNDGATVVATMLHGPKDDWSMTCVFTTGDRTSDDVCRRTVKTIRFAQ